MVSKSLILKITFVVLIIVIGISYFAWLITFDDRNYYDDKDDDDNDDDELEPENKTKYGLVEGRPIIESGYSLEYFDQLEVIDIPDCNIKSATFILNWTDEDDMNSSNRIYENQPDEFALEVETPGGDVYNTSYIQNSYGREGQVNLTINFEPSNYPDYSASGEYNVTIKCGDCGDFYPTMGLISYHDLGNDWNLKVVVKYYEEIE
ncbi:MAG: hypothetical protein JSV49_08600 [Thermoplasmata archaeon]|nr:MAG: hypothetical protein JSV49_08600 [Thermoplasmata archaeon]